MGKHDMPTLEFTVERGRLVPAGPYEAEVLNTYRPGSKLTITLHQKRSLPLLKKYWAVMRDVVDQCRTPWNSPDEASDAIKLALGVTDIGKTVKGQWFIRPGSIAFTSMDEAAFREYFEKAMAILAEVTGIDPVELRQRYSHIAEADSQSSDTPSPSDDTGSDGVSSSAAAADLSDTGDGVEAEAGDIEAQEEPDASSASEPIRTRADCLKAFMTTATDPDLDVAGRRDLLEQMKDWWKADLPNDLDFVKACLATSDKVAKGELGAEAARKYLEGIL